MYSETAHSSTIPYNQPGDAVERIALAEQRLGARFRDTELLLQALVHRSYILERERDGLDPIAIPSNERLEFLGDAVAGLLVARLAFETFPDYDEGQLTAVRSALVRRSTLALLAEEIGLGIFSIPDEQNRIGVERAMPLCLARPLRQYSLRSISIRGWLWHSIFSLQGSKEESRTFSSGPLA